MGAFDVRPERKPPNLCGQVGDRTGVSKPNARTLYCPSPVGGIGSDSQHRYGATPDEWDTFAYVLGLTPDMLPVVSNPHAIISPGSDLKEPGKTPSQYNTAGHVAGLANWTKRVSTDRDVERWANQADYGICVQTRLVRAIDVDVSDPILAAEIRREIVAFLGFEPPCRTRPNSSKFLFAIALPGEYTKRIIRTKQTTGEFDKAGNPRRHIIEFLAEGQQFIAAGTHTSGARYEWLPALPLGIPEVTPEQFEALWFCLAELFGAESTELRKSTGALVARKAADAKDPLVDWLFDKWEVLTEDSRTGRLDITCPFEDEHSGESSKSATSYFPAGIGGYERGHFKCQHAHCANRTDAEFIAAIGDPVLDSFDIIEGEAVHVPASDSDIAAGEADSAAGEWLPPTNDGAPHTQNDIGNVDILAERTRGNLRYVTEDDNWLYWGGNRWVVDTAGSRLLIACKSVAEHYAKEADRQEEAAKCAAKSEDAARMRKTAAGIRAWSIACGNRQRIDAMRALAKQDGRFAISASRLDTDPWLFGVANGVVDLRTGKLRPDSRGDYVTRRSPVTFDENAPAARWQDFVSEISAQPLPGGMRPRSGLASYLQKALGYSLTGSTREHKMFIAQGAGSNGKSVLLDIVKLVIGTDYCRVIPPAALMAARFDNGADAPSPIVRSLAGARLALSSESKDRQRLDAAVIKAQTGGGSITARGLHQNPLTFEITHKLWLMTNPKPDVDHLDAAFRGRLHMIPFSMRWNRPGEPGRDPLLPDGDKGLFDALRAELPGVLAWLVRGAVAYWREGLEPPEEVAQMTRDYFESQDALGQWLKTAEPCDPRVGASAAVLFEDFRKWCVDEGRDVQPATQTAFGRGLAERKIAKHRGEDGRRYAIKGRPAGMGF